jgi:hypothetical protein
MEIAKYQNLHDCNNNDEVPDSELNDKPELTKIEDTFNNEEFVKVQIREKLNNKFFKVCESGDIEKVKNMMNPKLSRDRRPDINSRYLHNYTVLHVSITNSKYFVI